MENLKEILKNKIKSEFDIEIGENLLEKIIHDKQRIKMFKEMGYI